MVVVGFVPAKAALLCVAFSFLALGCAGPDAVGGSRQAVIDWGQARGFAPRDIQAGQFRLLTMVRQSRPADTLSIYIEGDGAPWATPWRPPRDPTPVRPVSLALAAADPAPAVAYLGRPCQYLEADALASCDSAYWTGRRYAPEVVAAFDEAVTQLKASTGVGRIILVGHSGGGVIAALVAVRRRDVDRLITVAAPLALDVWAAWHRISPLEDSLDPGEATGPLPPGVHFSGADDKTVPPAIVAAYVRRRGGRLETVAGFDHECCWARDCAALLPRALAWQRAK